MSTNESWANIVAAGSLASTGSASLDQLVAAEELLDMMIDAKEIPDDLSELPASFVAFLLDGLSCQFELAIDAATDHETENG